MSFMTVTSMCVYVCTDAFIYTCTCSCLAGYYMLYMYIHVQYREVHTVYGTTLVHTVQVTAYSAGYYLHVYSTGYDIQYRILHVHDSEWIGRATCGLAC